MRNDLQQPEFSGLSQGFEALDRQSDTFRIRAFGLREHIATLFRHKRKIIAIFLATVTVAVVGSYLVSPVYIASSRILVQFNREPMRLSSGISQGGAALEFRPREQVLTEVEIFRSPFVARELVEDLGPDVVEQRMRWRWDWVRDLPDRAREWVKSQLLSWEPTRVVLGFFGIKEEPPGDVDKIAFVAPIISDNLEAEATVQTDVFGVSFTAPDPVFAATTLNKLVEIYLERHLALRQPQKAKEILDEEATRLRQQLRAAEDRLQEFKETWQIVSVESQEGLLLNRLSEAEADLHESRKNLAETDERLRETRDQLADGSANVRLSTVVARNPVADQLRTALVQLELEQKQYVEGSPASQRVKREIADIRARLRAMRRTVEGTRTSGPSKNYQELQKILAIEQASRSALKSRIDLSEEHVQEYRDALQKLVLREIEVRSLEREVKLKEEALLMFLRKSEEARISEALDLEKVSNVTQIEPAEPPILPASPRKKLNIILGIVVGLFGGIGVAYVSEFFRRSMSNREEAEAVLWRPVLAALWHTRRGREAARRNTVEFMRLGEAVAKVKGNHDSLTLLITSTVAGEGKSMVTTELANVLRGAGWKVVVVVDNADRKSPTATPQSLQRGAQDHVARGAESETRNLTKLEDSAIGEFKNDQDFILVDGDAVATNPDRLVIPPGPSAILFVVEADKTPAVSVRQSLRVLEDSGGQVLGIVLNKRIPYIPSWIYSWMLSPNRGG